MNAEYERESERRGYKRIYLHARAYAIPFYEGLGYHVFGEEFTEVGIPHRHMQKFTSGPKMGPVTQESSLVKWLMTDFQDALYQSTELSEKLADETKPFEYKYQARTLLKTLKERLAAQGPSDSVLFKLAECIIDFKLGVNFFDSEEFHDAENHLTEALNKFVPSLRSRQLNLLQDMYNHLGITHCNRGNNEKGLPFLTRAEDLYKEINEDKIASDDKLDDADAALLESIN